MDFDQLLMEQDTGGCVRFIRPAGFGGEHSDFTLETRQAFSFATILEAVVATGWVVERGGEWRIAQAIGCDRLARLVDRMSWYFDGPDVPGRELLRIKEYIETAFFDYGERLEIPFWACAWFDVILREDAADDARAVDQLWRKEQHTIDIARLSAARLRELRARYLPAGSRQRPERIAESVRSRSAGRLRGKSAS